MGEVDSGWGSLNICLTTADLCWKFWGDPSRFGLYMKVYKYLFWFGGYGHERPWPFRLGQVKDNFVSVYPLWTYSENILEISHDFVNKWKFISICFYWVAIAIIDHSHSGPRVAVVGSTSGSLQVFLTTVDVSWKLLQDPSRFGLDIKVYKNLFYLGCYGYDRSWPLRLSEF